MSRFWSDIFLMYKGTVSDRYHYTRDQTLVSVFRDPQPYPHTFLQAEYFVFVFS